MILSYMLGGIVLFRSGILLGTKAPKAYLPAAAACLSSAWALAFLRAERLEAAQWDFAASLRQEWIAYLEGPLGAFGYTGLVLGILSLGKAPAALAAAGRMAFTNYIACSLIGTTLAYGHGGSLYGHLTLGEILIAVGAVWAIILIASPLWLARFRFGPLEWVWRRLAYGRPIPFRRRSGPAPG
ncbi:DUF418 domain-containing protein, partial [Parvularcula oceani]|uniref:DUF418 domain-containing protein n=1 Tax=Parvularcula oceani TaxID=1247963 RepID=UPI0004E21899